MTDGQVRGWYNLVTADTYETFDTEVSVEEFIEMLREEAVPEEVTVTGLGEAFEDEALADELADAIDEEADYLESRHPKRAVQFAVEGSFRHRGELYDLLYEDDLYSLQRVFGTDIEREEEDWLLAPF